MGNLSSQYISQSFQSLLHLGSDTTASATLTEIQDALGNGVGVFVSTQGNLKVTNSISASAISASTLFGIGNTVSYSASVAAQLTALENITSSLITETGSYATTGSNQFFGNQSITGDINVTGTLTAYAVKAIFETSSVIYSSGSNQFGDASNDTQTLIGRTDISGSLSVTGSSIAFKGEVSASYISSSRIEGLGGTTVTNFSSSIASQFYTNTQLVDSFTGSIVQLNTFTASAATSIDNLQIFTASNAGTNAYTASNNTKWNVLGSQTGSYLITASVSASTITFTKQDTSTFNISVSAGFPFTGSALISGSLNVTGSVNITGSLNVTGSTINLKSGSSSGNVIDNITDTFTSTAKINHIVTLTSAEYIALSPKDSSSLYIII
jgi:hypothetical protein